MSSKRITLQRIRLTKEAIEKLPFPAEGRRYVYDDRIPGLGLCIYASRRRAWYLYRKVKGRPEREKIGEWPAYTVQMAIAEAQRLIGRVASGENPAEERRQRKLAEQPTLAEVFTEFVGQPTRTKAKRPRSPKTTAEYQRQFGNYLASWHNRRVKDITREDVEELHNSLGKRNGQYQANRVLALVKAILTFAVDRKYLDYNPAARIMAFSEDSRERFLGADEFPRFWTALEAEPSVKVRDFIKLLLFTGQRRSNVLGMRWSEIDFVRALWTIPMTKSGKTHEVPLSPPAMEVLTRRYSDRKDSEYVLPGRTGQGMQHLRDPMRQWRDITARAGITNLRLHDLRRTLGSWQTAEGVSAAVVGKSLGHAPGSSATAVYARAQLETVRDAIDAAAVAMLAAAKPPKKTKRSKKSA